MVYVALAEAAVIAVIVAAGTGLLRWLIRAHARERDLLLNQLLNLAGKPWQPAPADDTQNPWQDAALEARHQWTRSPEQEPVV